MSSFLHRFGRQRPESEFASWPPPPVPRPVPASFLPTNDAPVLPVQDDLHPQTQKYPRAIIIGLGETGEHVVRQWLEQLSHDPAGSQRWLRVCLIGQDDGGRLPEAQVPVQRLKLTDVRDFVSSVSYRPASLENQRGSVLSLFRTTHNLTQFQGWLDQCLRDLVSDIRVFVVASIADAIIGLLGDILQVLRLRPGQDTPYKNISALLSSETLRPENSLDDAEIYAVMREITRMTTGGIHKLHPLPVASGDVFHSALLDHAFFLGTGSGFPDALDLTSTSFADGPGQALAEFLFTLTHSSADLIWQHFQNVPHSNAVVHTAGIATLYIPVVEIQDYIASRLVNAVFYGERHDRSGEGLLAQSGHPVDNLEKAPILAYRWLNEGPCAHPLFLWLLGINTPGALQSLPDFEVREFAAAFQAQMAYGLSAFLNDPAEVDHLKQARQAIEWLETHFADLNTWLNSAQTVAPNAPVRLNFHDFLHRCRELLAVLKTQVQKWEEVVQLESRRAMPGGALDGIPDWHEAGVPPSLEAARRRQASPISTDWRTLPASSDDVAADWAIEPIAGLINKRRGDAETRLVKSTEGRIRRALIPRGGNAVREVENYYRDTIRPELSQHGLDNSKAFERLRERLAWWVKSIPDQSPELLLVCLPPHCSGAAIPGEACFSPRDVKKLVDTIHDVAALLVGGRRSDLTGNWLREQLRQAVGFLERAALPLLKYAHRGNEAPLYYLVGSTDITERYRGAVFQNPRNTVNELVGEADRFTALTLWDNIFLDSIELMKTAYAAYRPHVKLHLFPQERAAVVYENYFLRQLNLRGVVIPPGLILMLADPQLATLFFQALLGGLITPQPASEGGLRWTLASLGDFDPLPLAAAQTASDGQSLVESLRLFALEKPNDPIMRHELNPAEHFGQESKKFLEVLHQAAYRQRSQADFPQCSNQLLPLIDEWMSREDNAMMRAFAALLAVERHEPVWKDWNKIEETE